MIRLFRVFIPVSTFTLLITDILLLGLSFLAVSYALANVDPTDYLFYDGGILSILVVTRIFVIGIYFSGLYSDVYVKSKVILLYQILVVTGLSFLFEGLISSVAVQLRLPIHIMVSGSFLSVALLFGWRLLFSRYAVQMLGNAKILLVGTDPALEAVGRYIDSHPQSGFRLAGYVQEDREPAGWFESVKNFGNTNQLAEIIGAAKPSRVVVGMSSATTTEFARTLEDLRYAGQNIQEAAETYETVCGRVWVRGIEPAELIYTSHFGAPTRHATIQRFLHPAVALICLIVLSPIWALVWIYLKIRLSGPVVESHERVGMNQGRFRLYRFRLPHEDRRERRRSGFIRRFRLDGLPQFVNVLKGEMAFVGPRPERPEFLPALSDAIPYYPQRNCVLPGITGWAQIQQDPDEIDTLATLEYDLYYIKYMAMSLDTLIIFQTLRAMFSEAAEA